MVWLKRVIVTAVTVVVVTIVAGAYLLRKAPAWYARPTLTADQRDELAKRAEDQLLKTREFANQARAAEVRAATQGIVMAQSNESMVLQLSQEEVNSLLEKWGKKNGWQASYEKFVKDPAVFFHKGKIIIAGLVKEFGSVVSLQFSPKITANGQLDLDLVKVLGGNLPMPESMYSGYRDKLVQSLHGKLPQLQARATVRSDGTTNDDAVVAGMSRILLASFENENTDPILFLPLSPLGRGSVPVRVTKMEVNDGTMSLTIAPLNASERQTMIARIKQPLGSTAAISGQ
jgi:hypothetical protein